jgi:FAD/FMN-containing dehydrogenase
MRIKPAPDRYVPFNDGEPGRPLARAPCHDAEAVQAALGVACNFRIPVSVSSGRHDPYGRAKHDGCILLDMSLMSKVEYSPKLDTVTDEGGTKTGGLLAGLPDDVVTLTGTNAAIGVAGITCGGGCGMLTAISGLCAMCWSRRNLFSTMEVVS